MTDRRNFIKKASTIGASLGIGLSIHAKAANPEGMDGLFIHHVFFWLKDPENKENQRRFEKGLAELASIETIKIKHLGIPADTDREVIDNTYQYSLLVGFEDKEGHDVYQKHEKHLEFIRKFENLWEKVLVYDSINY